MGKAEYSRLDMKVSLVRIPLVVDDWSYYIEVKSTEVQSRLVAHKSREGLKSSLRMTRGQRLSEWLTMSESEGG